MRTYPRIGAMVQGVLFLPGMTCAGIVSACGPSRATPAWLPVIATGWGCLRSEAGTLGLGRAPITKS